MARSSPRYQHRFLFIALLCGLLALLFTGYGLMKVNFANWSVLFYEAAAFLTFEPPREPADASNHLALALARVFVLAFYALGVLGLLLELYRPASDAFLRANFWWLRTVGRIEYRAVRTSRKEQAVVIGLGWIGGPLAKELRTRGRPVYGTALEEESPTAVEARRSGTLVVVGDTTDPATRARAGLPGASEVFIATGDDARNVEIAGHLLADAREARPRWFVRRAWNRLRHVAEETRLGFRNDSNPLRCYVHIGDPALLTTLRRHGLLKDRAGVLEFHLFSNREAAARQLFLDRAEGLALQPAYAPCPGEVFHLFVFGFGATGQTVALHAARLAHFAGVEPGKAFRSRLTIFDAFTRAACALERDRFRDRFPAFAPADLSFDPPEGGRTEAGEEEDTPRDGWAARPGRPAHDEFRMERYVRLALRPDARGRREDRIEDTSEQRPPDWRNTEDDGRQRWVRPVEYAINAEFLALGSDVESQAVVDAIAARLSPQGPPVRGAAIFCFEEERESFHAALRFRRALARRLTSSGKVRADQRPVLPIYVYLPADEGFVELIARRDESGDEERLLPLHVFGRQVEVNTYDAITRGDVRRRADHIASTHRILSGRRETHLDFAASNEESALHGPVKLAALDIRFSSHPVDGTDEVPVLAGLMSEEVVRAHRQLEREEAHRRTREIKAFERAQAASRRQERDGRKRPSAEDSPGSTRYDGRIRFRPASTRASAEGAPESREPVSADFVANWPVFGEGALPPELRQRLALLERVYVPPLPPLPERPAERDETPEERANRTEIARRRKQIADFDLYVRQQARGAIARFGAELQEKAGRNADVAAEMEHNRWMGERLSRGWRFGERAEFRRPTMVPWEDLTIEDDRHYDRAHLPRLILEQGPSAAPQEPERTPLYAYLSVPTRGRQPDPDDPAAAMPVVAADAVRAGSEPEAPGVQPLSPGSTAEAAPPSSAAGDTESDRVP